MKRRSRKDIQRKKMKTRTVRQRPRTAKEEEANLKQFLDMITPTGIRFERGLYVCGNTWRCVWAIRSYPASTDEQALLQHLGEKAGVTLHIYTRVVSVVERDKILANAEKANRLRRISTENITDVVAAESNLQDVKDVVRRSHREQERFQHTAVYIEMTADDPDQLKQLHDDVYAELSAVKVTVDKLLLRQQTGFFCAMPSGWNAFGEEFERVLPDSSVANLYPFAYSGKIDPHGFCIGRDKYGSSVFVDFNRRSPDKTNGNILILGNSGQGKSYLLKLILTCLLESGTNAICLDPESEYKDLTLNIGGCYVDLMSGQYIINVLEPRRWAEENEADDPLAPAAFRARTALSQHISFLRDFFRSYKTFTDAEIDTIEILLEKLYAKFGITDNTDFAALKHTDYPTLSDLHDFVVAQFQSDDSNALYTKDLLRSVALGLHSICKGAESKFFNGHTNITSQRFLTFGVKGLLEASANIRNAMLFNVLSYMSGELLTNGNTVAAIDELYLFLTNPTAIEYLRNMVKRVRKKESAMIFASQNVEDFALPGVAEMTKPLFSIPTHQFLFHPGNVGKAEYMEMLQLNETEYNIIRNCRRGNSLYRCGTERYNLLVKAPDYKQRLFGTAGGR